MNTPKTIARMPVRPAPHVKTTTFRRDGEQGVNDVFVLLKAAGFILPPPGLHCLLVNERFARLGADLRRATHPGQPGQA